MKVVVPTVSAILLAPLTITFADVLRRGQPKEKSDMTSAMKLAVTVAVVVVAYLLGWVLWTAALYLDVALQPPGISPWTSMFLIPGVFASGVVAWWVAFVVAPQRNWRLRMRRMIELVIAGVVSGRTKFAHLLAPAWFADASCRCQPVGAVAAIVLMGAVVVASLLRDRSIELALALTVMVVIAIVPVVIAGRGAAVVLAHGLWTMRQSHL